eukprot:13080152-Heterocapsa_arctica.AAC.1
MENRKCDAENELDFHVRHDRWQRNANITQRDSKGGSEKIMANRSTIGQITCQDKFTKGGQHRGDSTHPDDERRKKEHTVTTTFTKRRVNVRGQYYPVENQNNKGFEESIGWTFNRRALNNRLCRVGPVWTEFPLNKS